MQRPRRPRSEKSSIGRSDGARHKAHGALPPALAVGSVCVCSSCADARILWRLDLSLRRIDAPGLICTTPRGDLNGDGGHQGARPLIAIGNPTMPIFGRKPVDTDFLDAPLKQARRQARIAAVARL
jgi:hypothetical protein